MDIDTIQRIAIPILTKYGITRASIFGSYARGEEKSYSDIDLLIGYPSEANMSLFKLVELREELEKLLDKNIDIVTDNGISPKIKKFILKDTKVIYDIESNCLNDY